MTQRNGLVLLSAIIVILIATSCTSGPPAPRIGTPPFYWQAAAETFAAGDYVKTNSHLEELIKTDNEYTTRAQPFRLVLTAGLARGYAELAETFELGARANRANPTPFRTRMSDYRRLAGRRAFNFAETFLKFSQHDHTQNVVLDFSYPTGSPATPRDLDSVGRGMLLPEAKVDTLERQMLERGVLLATCEAVGAPEDPAKAQEVFKAEKVEVPHDVFALAMARNLHEQAELFSRENLDRPDQLELFCNEALKALETVKGSKETKALAADIQKTLKSMKRR